MRKSERIIIGCTVLIMVLMLIISSTYAFFSYKAEQEQLNEFTAPCYDVTYAQGDNDNVQILNAYPSTDEEGLKQTPYTLTVTNNCPNTITYNTILNVTEESTTPNYLMKVGVTHDSEDEILELKNITPDETSSEFPYRYILTTDSLEQGKSKTYDFRAWMNENVKFTDVDNGFNTSFINKISIELIYRETKTILGVTYPIIEEEPNFKEGFPNANTSEDDITKGSGLYKTEDDYGGTSYIFRGQVDNNYVHFANQDWRILRVNGDGTIRLMLKDRITYQETTDIMFNDFVYNPSTPQHDKVGFTSGGDPCLIDNPCEVTYDNVSRKFTNENGGTNSNIKEALEEWYKTNLNEFDEQIAYGLFCNDISYGSGTDDTGSTSTLHYGAYQRLASSSTNVTPTLVCPEQVDQNKQPRTYGGLYKSKIGLITADELAIGGYSPMYSTSKNTTDKNYLRRSYWTASPYSSNGNANVFAAVFTGNLENDGTYNSWAVVPVINLKTDKLTYSGTGEVNDPIDIQ